MKISRMSGKYPFEEPAPHQRGGRGMLKIPVLKGSFGSKNY
jgi:hypothetical protein